MELIQYYRREKSKDQRVKKSKTQDKNHQIFKFSNLQIIFLNQKSV